MSLANVPNSICIWGGGAGRAMIMIFYFLEADNLDFYDKSGKEYANAARAEKETPISLQRIKF